MNGTEVREHLADAYYTVTGGAERDVFTSLAAIRAALPHVPRADLDAELRDMFRAQVINLVPQSWQQGLTAADHDAAIRLGGEVKHLIAWSA